jgi:hypothetical protein
MFPKSSPTRKKSIWFNQKNQSDWIDWAEQQFNLWENYGKLSSGWYQTKIDCRKPLPVKPPLRLSLYDYQDAVLGFYGMYLVTGKDLYRERMVALLTRISSIATKHAYKIPNQILTKMSWAVPWTSHNPAVAGIIAEHALLLGNKEQNQKLIKFGHKLIDAQLSTESWQKYHFFHQGYNVYLPRVSPYKYGKIMKENSNMIYAMVHSSTYEPMLKQFIKNLLHLQHESDGFWSQWDMKHQQLDTRFFDKTQNFTIIDLLITLSERVNYYPNLITAATTCADFWLAQKSSQTGLIPDYLLPSGDALYPVAKLDQTADLYSSFLRLHSITGDNKYLNEALLGASYMANTFGQSEWWYRIVDVTTGKPANDEVVSPNDRPANRNLTKYVGGALRFYLSLYEVINDKHMYNDELLQIMSRDR